MEVIISIVGSLAAKAAEYTVDPTIRQLSYLFKPKTKFLNLRSKVQELKDARERLQQSVDSANRKGEVIFDDVQRWLTVANEKISEEDEEKAMKRCFAGFCPDFKSSYQLSKKADREANAIAQLLTKKDAFNAVGYLPAVEVMDIIRPVKEYEAFASRNGAFDRVMAALEDDAVSIIGVYGMGGVGKTTLVKEAAKQAKEKQLFTEVVLVSIKQKPNMLNIQKEIAEKLGMTLSEDNIDVRAARLCERLKAKRILVVLDDIWESLELEALGISSGDEHKGCKMLMTSRRLDVLESLNSQPNISIETLKQDEAWTLFKIMAGLVEGSDFQSTAVEVAKRCAGLPIAIATIAKALKPKKNLFEWKDALQQLSQPSERNFKGTPKDAYLAIELSYTFLDAEELGPIFLLCSIMGHDADPEDLLRYAIGLGFIHGLNDMEARRNRILTSVNNLKASCLLLEGSRPNRFDMHDVVRDVAQSIASRDLHWLALTKEWPDEEKMKESQLISLQNVEDSGLLNHELECPNLDYFSVFLERSSSLKISENFFKGMQRLKVLEFGETNFRALPSSIGCLKTLCTLRLRGCDFKDIGILGELGKLEILDLSRSAMEMLPKEIGQLTRLKLLDLSRCYNLKVISPNVLSKLSRLEELYLYDSFDRWEVEGIENPRRNSSLVELQHLPLTTLEVHIPHVEVIPKDNLFLGKMERFKISIGDEKWDPFWDIKMKTSRMLKLKMNKSIYLVDGIKLLLGKTQSLYLDGSEDVGEMQMLCHPNVESFGQLKFMKVKNCNMLKNLFSFSIAKTLCQLEELEVFDCKNITELIAENEEIDENDILEFNKLRILELENLQSFNGLLYSENTPQSSPWLFDKKVSCPALEELRVKRCHKLKHVFTSSMVKSFVHLKKLMVSECKGVEGVIEGTLAAEGINSSIRVFPKLDYLDLDRLPKLREFCCGINSIEFPSLRVLAIQDCHDLKTFVFDDVKSRVASSHCLFNEKVIFPVLEELIIAKIDKLKRLWPDLLVENSFSRLTSIRLQSCPKLLNVFPLSVFTRLQRLDKIYLWNCESVEEIIFGSEYRSQGGSSSAKDVITFEFPALTSLALNYLPKLKSIHHNKMHTINWPSLKHMNVGGCPAVEILFASGETSSEQPLFWVNESTFPNLHQLTLESNAGSKEIIFQSEEGGEEKPASLLLSQITELRLFYLTELMHLWKEKEGFPNLWFLYVKDCSGLKANLVPSSVSFLNLVILKVKRCHGIVKLITHSTAKSLVQLKQMSIKSCKNIEEIIQGEDDDDEISFPHLNRLHLEYLPKLESFCSSEKYTFKFRSLEYLQVHNCPNMKLFSKKDARTPLLHKVLIHDYGSEVRWEGSLNNTIQELFREEHTISTFTYSEEIENYEEECETKEDQDNPSTSNTQAITEIVGDDTTR